MPRNNNVINIESNGSGGVGIVNPNYNLNVYNNQDLYWNNMENNTLFISPNIQLKHFTISFSDAPWFMRVESNGKIIFNEKDYPNLTEDEKAQKFLKALSHITHIEEKQFTFDF